MHAEGRRFDSAYLHHKLADVRSMIGHWREDFAAVIQAWPGRTGRKHRRGLIIYNLIGEWEGNSKVLEK